MKSLFGILLLTLSPSVLAQNTELSEATALYLQEAKAVVDKLPTPEKNQEIVAHIDALLEAAKPVVTAFGQRHGQCQEQLEVLLNLYPQIASWSAAEIRQNIEVGKALPAARGCYAARDVIAHPAIVRVYARQAYDIEKAPGLIEEMQEAIEHMEELERELAQ